MGKKEKKKLLADHYKISTAPLWMTVNTTARYNHYKHTLYFVRSCHLKL